MGHLGDLIGVQRQREICHLSSSKCVQNNNDRLLGGIGLNWEREKWDEGKERGERRRKLLNDTKRNM